jgi:hypothetical protein
MSCLVASRGDCGFWGVTAAQAGGPTETFDAIIAQDRGPTETRDVAASQARGLTKTRDATTAHAGRPPEA